MTKQLSPQQQLSVSNQPVIDDLFDLTASRDLDVMLGKALRITTRILGAEAGSILFKAHPLRNIQSGAFRPEAIKHIEQWEKVIGQRLQQTNWNIPGSAPLPISIISLTNTKLVLINVPLLQDTKVVGSLSLVLSPGSQLGLSQHNLITRIAKGLGQIASLIADLELANRRLHEISVFYDVGQALVTTFDIGNLLLETMELATSLIDAGAASIMLIDEARKELVFKVSHGNRKNALRQHRIPMDEGIAGWVIRHGKPVIANDARADTRFSHRVDVRTGFLTQSIAAVPLEIKGRMIGVMEVLNKYSGSGFDQEDIKLMTFIAAQAAIAIENARLYDQLREERDSMIQVQENMRRELTETLQDGPAQFLSAINMGLDHLERLSTSANPEVMQNQIGALRNLVNQTTRSVHDMLFELHPVILQTEGLVAACEQYITQLRKTENFSVHFTSTEQPINYNAEVTAAIFAIAQEAITNIKRHANTKNMWLALEVNRNHFVVTIKDDGQGFDIRQINNLLKQKAAYGILNMRERAAAISADLQIESNPKASGQGTTVRLLVPWPPVNTSRTVE